MESCVLVFPGKPGLKYSEVLFKSYVFPLLSFILIFIFEIYDVKFQCNNQVLQQGNRWSWIVDTIWNRTIDLACIGKFITLL